MTVLLNTENTEKHVTYHTDTSHSDTKLMTHHTVDPKFVSLEFRHLCIIIQVPDPDSRLMATLKSHHSLHYILKIKHLLLTLSFIYFSKENYEILF